jgi:hypothetical protein
MDRTPEGRRRRHCRVAANLERYSLLPTYFFGLGPAFGAGFGAAFGAVCGFGSDFTSDFGSVFVSGSVCPVSV